MTCEGTGQTIIGGSCHKYHFCRGKHTFVATNTCLSRQNTFFCRDKSMLAVTKNVSRENCLSRQIATKIICLSRQKFYRDKHIFVATDTCLSRQKLYLWQLPPMKPNGSSGLTGPSKTESVPYSPDSTTATMPICRELF